MTPRAQPILAIVALLVFTGLSIAMLCLGEPTNAIASLILAIVLGVTQLLQALAGLSRSRDSRRPTPPLPLAGIAKPEPEVRHGGRRGHHHGRRRRHCGRRR